MDEVSFCLDTTALHLLFWLQDYMPRFKRAWNRKLEYHPRDAIIHAFGINGPVSLAPTVDNPNVKARFSVSVNEVLQAVDTGPGSHIRPWPDAITGEITPLAPARVDVLLRCRVSFAKSAYLQLLRDIAERYPEAQAQLSAPRDTERASTDGFRSVSGSQRRPQDSGITLTLACTYTARTTVEGAARAIREFVETREGSAFSATSVGNTRLLDGQDGVWALSNDGVSYAQHSEGMPSPTVLSVRVRKDPKAEYETYVLVELYAHPEAKCEEARALLDAMAEWWPEPGETEAAATLSYHGDALEVRLRDLIDKVLSQGMGAQYWGRALPSDTQSRVKKRMADAHERLPYVSSEGDASGRMKLDYCDVSDYEKVIVANWLSFQSVFLNESEFRKHISHYQNLRNNVKHNRVPTDVEERLGEAAILWFNHVLDAYGDTVAEAHDDEVKLDDGGQPA